MIKKEIEEVIKYYSGENSFTIDIEIDLIKGNKRETIRKVFNKEEEVTITVKIKSNSNEKNEQVGKEDDFWKEMLNM